MNIVLNVNLQDRLEAIHLANAYTAIVYKMKSVENLNWQVDIGKGYFYVHGRGYPQSLDVFDSNQCVIRRKDGALLYYGKGGDIRQSFLQLERDFIIKKPRIKKHSRKIGRGK
jgi:hypothetical protein